MECPWWPGLLIRYLFNDKRIVYTIGIVYITGTVYGARIVYGAGIAYGTEMERVISKAFLGMMVVSYAPAHRRFHLSRFPSVLRSECTVLLPFFKRGDRSS